METVKTTKIPLTPAEKVFFFMNAAHQQAEYHQGYSSSLRKIRRLINDNSTVEEITKICEDRRDNLFKRIDQRTDGNPMSRPDEMTKYEKGAIYGAESVLNALNRKFEDVPVQTNVSKTKEQPLLV